MPDKDPLDTCNGHGTGVARYVVTPSLTRGTPMSDLPSFGTQYRRWELQRHEPVHRNSPRRSHRRIVSSQTISRPVENTKSLSVTRLIYSRVFGCPGSTNDEIVMQALMQAYHDNVDVINLSLSNNNGGWPEAVTSVVASRIAGLGKVVVASAGNLQAYGPFYAAAPASGLGVINVGSIDSYVTSRAAPGAMRPVLMFSF